MMIVVCPVSRVTDLVARHRPERVISMLDPDWPFPELGPTYGDRHLRLHFHDIQVPAPNQIMPSAQHIGELIRFVSAWDRKNTILIHCRAGISRSTAAAYIAACFANPQTDEYDIAAALRLASPLARPNQAIVELADGQLGRNGRMSAAIAATGHNLPWIEVHESEPFQMSILPS
jgi:predicted protein tyrosine phosphatase